MKTETDQILDTICNQTKNPTLLNALHACREGHPWNIPGKNHFYNAWFVATQRREINNAELNWLHTQSKVWEYENRNMNND